MHCPYRRIPSRAGDPGPWPCFSDGTVCGSIGLKCDVVRTRLNRVKGERSPQFEEFRRQMQQGRK